MTTRLMTLAAAACAALASTNAFADDHGTRHGAHPHSVAPAYPQSQPYPHPSPYPQSYPYPGGPGPHAHAADSPDAERARAEWLDDCANRYLSGRNKDGSAVAGAAIGAIAGGVAGNRIAGRGDRLGGTLLGAGVGGLAGLAIGSAIDRSKLTREQGEAYDWCINYLDSYYAQNSGYARGGGYPQPYPYHSPHGPMAYAIPYGPPMMMMPVMIPVQRCHEHEVIEEVVERPRVIYEKRVRMVPSKRIKYTKRPTKYVKSAK